MRVLCSGCERDIDRSGRGSRGRFIDTFSDPYLCAIELYAFYGTELTSSQTALCWVCRDALYKHHKCPTLPKVPYRPLFHEHDRQSITMPARRSCMQRVIDACNDRKEFEYPELPPPPPPPVR